MCSACLVVPRQRLVRDDQEKKVVTGLGHVAVTKTWEDGMAGRHSQVDTCPSSKEVGGTVHWECA